MSVDKLQPIPDYGYHTLGKFTADRRSGNSAPRHSAMIFPRTRSVMKLHGVVKGTTIELEANPELPDGQRVVVELQIATTGLNTDRSSARDLQHRVATDTGFESIGRTRLLRERITARLGGNLLDSADLIREDRTR